MTNEDSKIAHGTFSHRHTVSASRGPDYSLGAEPVDIKGLHCPSTATKERQSRTQEFSPPHGAFREGGPDIEERNDEEDEFTVTIEEENEEQAPILTREELIDPVSAKLVNTEEEEMHLQEKINQALERERQQAVVAEVVVVGEVAPALPMMETWRKVTLIDLAPEEGNGLSLVRSC
jgi:hypothetical protein